MFAIEKTDFSLTYKNTSPVKTDSFNSGDLLSFYQNTVYSNELELEISRNETPRTPVYSYKSHASSSPEQKTGNIFYRFFHWLAGKIIMPISFWGSKTEATTFRKRCLQPPETYYSSGGLIEWKHKRISIDVNGVLIDAMIVVRPETAKNGRWMIKSGGNCELYETGLGDHSQLKTFLLNLETNAILFNYQGIGASEGSPSLEEVKNAYRAVLSFLEEKIEAKEIIGYGFSIGAGIQAEALKDRPLKGGVSYAFIQDRTFSSLSKVAESIFYPLGGLVKRMGWDINGAALPDEILNKTIIIQTLSEGQQGMNSHLTKESMRDHDGVISKTASLAYELLGRENEKKGKVLGTLSMHNESLDDTEVNQISKEIRTVLPKRTRRARTLQI